MGWLKKGSDGSVEAAGSNSGNRFGGFSGINSDGTNRKSYDTYYVTRSKLKSLDDIEKIKMDLERGYILILDASDLLKSNTLSVLELKRAIDQIRGFCKDMGGSIGRIGEEFLVITPDSSIKII